jgi:type II secretory pathway component PulM
VSALIARLRDLFENLSPRERLLVGGVGGLLGLLLAWALLLNPVLSAQRRASLRVATAEQEIQTLARMKGDLDEVNGRLARVEGRIAQGPQGNIFTTLESLARQSAVKVESMEPQAAPTTGRYRETKVQVTLKGVTLPQVVSYLSGIESAAQPLSVKSLRMRTRQDKPELLDVTFTVSSFEVAG